MFGRKNREWISRQFGGSKLLESQLLFVSADYLLLSLVYMCGRENRERISRQLGSYKLLESQLLANCSNRAAAAAEDAGKNMT
jgi:hypothetical protein